MTGVHRSRRLGAGLEFNQYRKYAPGDDIRQLDWHLFARTDELAVRLQTPDTPFRLAIVLDATPSMAYRGVASPCTKFRFASIVAAALGYMASRQGDELGLFAYSDRITEYSGVRLPFQAFCHNLDSAKPADRGVLGNPMQALEAAENFLVHRGMTIWISDFLDDEDKLVERLRGLQSAGKGVIAIQILDPDEKYLPFQDALRFQDPEDAEHYLDTYPQDVRQEYLQRFKAHQQHIREICNDQEVTLLRMTTTEEIGAKLASLFA